MKLMYIDVETTGLDREKDDIIQLAGIISANGQRETFNFNIRSDVELSEGAYMAHRKTQEEIASYPSSSEIFPQFMELLSKHVKKYDRADKFFFIGYNAGFDMDFVREWFKKNDESYFGSWFHFPPLDVMQMANFHLIGKRHMMKNFRLTTVYEEIMGKTFPDAHDALADITATSELLDEIMRRQKSF